MKRTIYTNLFLVWSSVVIPILSFGQIYSNTFTGTSACPTQGNTPTVSSNATGASLTRSTMTCTSAGNVFNSTTLNNTASINNASYIEFSVTANAGAQLNVTSLSFFRQASGTAPNQLEVRYSTDGFGTSTSWGSAPTSFTAGTTTTWDFADFSVLPGITLTVRFYPYGTQRADLTTSASSSSGTFRVDDVTLNGAAPLPVKLVSFTGKSGANVVTLNWVTAWEEKNRGFDVQKSTDAQRFEAAGFVDGNTTTQVQSVYAFTDVNVLPEQLYYYRLKQKDVGGGSNFSAIIAVRAKAGEQEEQSAIYPNPSKGLFTLSGQDSDLATIKLFTVSGLEIPINTTQTENPKTLDIAAKTTLTPGTYYLKVNSVNGAKIKALKVLIY